MSKLTFEKILAAYMVLAALMAMALPYGLAIEDLLPISAPSVPIARWLSMAPGALPFLSTYFFILVGLIPLVVVGFATYPREEQHFAYLIPSLGRCIGATAFAAIAAAALMHFAFLDAPPGSNGYRRTHIAYLAATSRLGLAVFGPPIVGTYAIVAYVFAVKVPRIWLGYRRNQFG